MQIEFDSAKDGSNRAKNGVSLVLAADLDWDSALIWQDTRHAYGEVRMVALAPHAQILYFVAYVDRGARCSPHHQPAPRKHPGVHAI